MSFVNYMAKKKATNDTKGKSEAVIRRRTDNTMAKIKATKDKGQQ
jgi:hypothetical protein